MVCNDGVSFTTRNILPRIIVDWKQSSSFGRWLQVVPFRLEKDSIAVKVSETEPITHTQPYLSIAPGRGSAFAHRLDTSINHCTI